MAESEIPCSCVCTINLIMRAFIQDVTLYFFGLGKKWNPGFPQTEWGFQLLSCWMKNTELQHTLSTVMRQRWYDPKIRESILISDEIGFMNLSVSRNRHGVRNVFSFDSFSYVMCLLRLSKMWCVRKPIYLLYSGVWHPQTVVNRT